MYSDVSKNDARPPVAATPPLRNPERDPPASTPPPPRPENRAQIRYFSPLGKLQKKGINYIYTPVDPLIHGHELRGRIQWRFVTPCDHTMTLEASRVIVWSQGVAKRRITHH
eukprot:COSAG06_NODE_1474_length_9343_cov_29.287322_3_plen_112_part_00